MSDRGIKMQSKILSMLLLLTLNLFAVEGTMRVKLQSYENLYTSQKVIVAVELLTSAFSISDARIIFPSSPKYIVNAPKSAAYIRTEEINGTDWQMVHYEYEIYALQAGEIEISPIKATFSASMGYGQPKKAFNLKSKALHFSVLSPKGIKKEQFVLVTDNYTLKQKTDPKKSELIVGDAVEVEITQKAHAVPDILLKPIHYKSTPALRIYEKEPVLQSGLKGSFDVSRRDHFTFVAAAEGNVSIPEQKMLWWNSSSEEVKIETAPAMHFTIIADPQIALDAKRAAQKRLLVYLALALLLLLVIYKFSAARIKDYLAKRKRVYKASEEGKFKALLETVRQENAPAAYKAFYNWLSISSPPLFKGGFSAIVKRQPSFEDSLRRLEESMLDPKQRFDTIDFTKELIKLRKALHLQKQSIKERLPKTINPK
jgi:hypothetical protein